jgi:simple sugar transport system permease protein
MNAANSESVKRGFAVAEGAPVEPAERGPRHDERLGQRGIVRSVVSRPGFGAVAGIVIVFLFFALGSKSFTQPGAVSTWLAPSSLIGLSAVPIALLMIGGEFDLSAGVMIGSTSLVTGLLCTELHWNIWPALLVSLVFAVGIGLFNGLLVTRTGLPSFIVTLGSFFILQGLNTGVTQLITGNVLVTGVNLAPGFGVLQYITGSYFTIGGVEIQISIVWWIAFTAIGAIVLSRTAVGNWIMSVGGDSAAARGLGVPVGRVKIGLFTASSVMAWFVGAITVSQLGTVTTNQGVGQELVFIIAAVVGGCLLTGGYGSVIGASASALIFGMVQVGIFYKGWNSTFYYAFLGAVLLVAVIANIIIRKRLEVS